MTKDETIEKLWGESNHGTQREDIEAAYNAGAAAERMACKAACENERLGCVLGDSDQAYENAITHCVAAIDAL